MKIFSLFSSYLDTQDLAGGKQREVGRRSITAGICLALATTIAASHSDAESTLPKLTIDQLVYQGGFRLPNGTYGDSTSAYSYGAIGFNPDRNSLFVAGHEYHSAIAEFAIPGLVNSTKLSDLKMASAPIQNFSDVLHKASIDWGQGLRIDGIFYSGKKLLVNLYRFYDQSPFLQTPTMILEDATNIKASATKGYITVQNGVRAAGWISPIPTEFRSVLGGTHISGMTNSTLRAIIYNASVGPAAYSFNPVSLMSQSTSLASIPNTELINYTLANGLVPENDLYNESRTNKLWTHASEGSFGMIIPGTRTYLVLGGSGGHQSGMAYGTPPYGGYKGHYTIDQKDNYPYYWMYDVNDMEKVKKGSMKAYEIKPYAFGKFNAPFQTSIVNPVAGGSYDESNGILYLSLRSADNLQDGNPPVIVAYKFNVASSASQSQSPPQAPSSLSIKATN